MYWVISLVGALLVGALLTYLLATVFGRGEDLPPVSRSPWAEEHAAQLEQQEITSDSVGKVGFTMSLRGYNQAEVDQYLQRISEKLRAYESSENATSHVTARQVTTSQGDTQ